MNPLFILLQTSALTEGAKRMAATDPHGWTLSLIAVTVVFTALVILFLAFTLVGKISMALDARSAKPKTGRKAAKKARAAHAGVTGAVGATGAAGAAPDAETAAAIALALEAENGGGVPVAISTALALYLGHGVHDSEPYTITIKRAPSAWDSPELRFRKNPVK